MRLASSVHYCLLLLVLLWLPVEMVAAQADDFDPAWLDADQPHVKVGVAEDGVYRITADDLARAGISPSAVDLSSLRLIENGRSIPFHLEAESELTFGGDDALFFAGYRNRGDDEAWAYDYDTSLQSSTYRSLYSDTTFYWLTWSGDAGPRYQQMDELPEGIPTDVVRDTVRLEEDRIYYYGDTQAEAGSPIFTRGEGYYWHNFNHGTSTDPISRTYTLPVSRKSSVNGSMEVAVRLSGQTNTQHRVTLEVQGADGSTSFVELDEADWYGYSFQTLSATVPQADLPEGNVQVRVTSHNEFGASPNRVLLDWVEARYNRVLIAENDVQRFSVSEGGEYSFRLSGYSAERLYLLNTSDGRLFVDTSTGAERQISDHPQGAAVYWAATETAMKSPASIRAAEPVDWARPDRQADYVILTTELLLPSAEELAEYRSAHNGFTVAIVDIQEVFDQFDYGRSTPIAIRRFVHQTQQWSTPPQFMAIWADAVYPVRTARQHIEDAPWNVPAFGYSPSDPWYALQYRGRNDWSEILAIGRLPIRSNDEGHIILQKIQDYESAQLQDWQKRALMLSGGTSESERRRLRAYSQQWADVAAAVPMGADTLFFTKRSDESLDTSFQNDLRRALRDGAGWLNYFGHSAAQTWEIVTDPPGDFDNAGRLPFVVSLGCQTGAFAGGRFDEGVSYGEQLLLGMDAGGNPSLNGAIAHFGTSYLGSISASALLNDELVEKVFTDTMQIAGLAIRDAKAQLAANHADSRLIRDHLLQYSLLGDPALTLSLPDQPDFHLTAEQITAEPAQPLPGDTLRISVRLENRGLVPAQPVDLVMDHHPPSGESQRFERVVEPFRLSSTQTVPVPLGSGSVGEHRLRAEADPDGHIDEVRRDNNVSERPVMVLARGVQLVAPFDRAIATSASPEFRLAVAGLAEETPLHLQIASDPSFATTIDEAFTSTDEMLLKWQPTQQLVHGETYHWRARIDEPPDEEDRDAPWQEAAFTVRTDMQETGWLQQGGLFGENELDGLNYDSDSGWSFAEFQREILSSSERGFGALKGQFNVDGDETYERLRLGFGLLLVDGQSGQVKDSGSFCTYRVSDPSLLDTTCTGEVDGEQAISLLEDFVAGVEVGDHLFVRTRHLGRSGETTIPDRVKEAFRSLGTSEQRYSQAIDTLTYNDLWIAEATIGEPERTIEIVDPAGSGENEITYQSTLTFSVAEGHAMTPVIGPVRSWGHLSWEAELSGAQDIQVDVLAADGSEVLIDGADGPSASHHLSGLNPRHHPFLRLRATLSDETNRTAPQLGSWHVTYDPPAELAIDGRTASLSADSVLAGHVVDASADLINLTDHRADQVAVTFEVTHETNRTEVVARDTLSNIGGDAVETVHASFSTEGFRGPSYLTIRADQPHQRQRLGGVNSTSIPFFLRGDGGPSNVRVLVEGRELPHDPEPLTDLQDARLPFVGARPVIEIEVEQQDGGLPLDRPDRVGIYLNCDPVGTDFGCQPVPESDTTFVPSPSPDDAARVYYEPDLSGRDTTHTLRVLVEDRQGNRVTGPDSEVTYQLHFRVQSDMEVRDLYPYPNPMVTHTQFAFRIMGGDVGMIEDFRIRIYTLAGRLVRELDLRPAVGHQDWNSIEWDGTDQTGHRVATGVYLYSVFLRTADGPIEVNDGRPEKVVVIR